MSITEDTQTTAAILRDAAKVMIKGGYIAGIRYGEDTGNKTGSHCALGAIEVAAGMGRYSANDRTPAVVALAKTIAVINPSWLHEHHQTTVANWNNQHYRTAKEVACVMRATAKALEEESNDGK